MTAVRKRLGQLRTKTINQVKYLLRKHNLEQECPTKGLDTIQGKKWLAELTLKRTCGPDSRHTFVQAVEDKNQRMALITAA